jgi:hypothetical protein
MPKPWYVYLFVFVFAIISFLFLHRALVKLEGRRIPTELERECERLAALDTLIVFLVWVFFLSLPLPFPSNESGIEGRILFAACFYGFYRLSFYLRKKYKFLK